MKNSEIHYFAMWMLLPPFFAVSALLFAFTQSLVFTFAMSISILICILSIKHVIDIQLNFKRALREAERKRHREEAEINEQMARMRMRARNERHRNQYEEWRKANRKSEKETYTETQKPRQKLG